MANKYEKRPNRVQMKNEKCRKTTLLQQPERTRRKKAEQLKLRMATVMQILRQHGSDRRRMTLITRSSYQYQYQ